MTKLCLPVENCQNCCSKNLNSIMFLGYLPPVNEMPEQKIKPVEEKVYPLELLQCDDCGLVQLGAEIDKTVIFPESYPYLSGVTKALHENFESQAELMVKQFGLSPRDLVVDIGSNDGTLLSKYAKHQVKVIGIEPSQAADKANENGIHTLKCYFNESTVDEILESHGHAKIVTACNVFAHIPEIHSVITAITKLLSKDGVFVSESHYLPSLIETLQYDTIYHEHLRYYHLGVLSQMFEKHGLEVFDAETIPTHGGSIRVYASHKGVKQISKKVDAIINKENKVGISSGIAIVGFKKSVVSARLGLLTLLAKVLKANKTIVGIGAPSRASTLISYTGLDQEIISCVLELKGSHKIGKFMPGTRIPVLEETGERLSKTDYALVFSWHIASEIIKNMKKHGYKGDFIIPLPSPKIILNHEV